MIDDLRVSVVAVLLLCCSTAAGQGSATPECNTLPACSAPKQASRGLVPDPYLRAASTTAEDLGYDDSLDRLLSIQRRLTTLELLAWEVNDSLESGATIFGAAVDPLLVQAQRTALSLQIEAVRAAVRNAEVDAAMWRDRRESEAGPAASTPGYRGTPIQRETLLVLFKAGVPDEEREVILRQRGLRQRWRSGEIPLYVVDADDPMQNRQYEGEAARLRVLVEELNDHPLVEAAVQNVTLCKDTITPPIDSALRDWFGSDNPLVESRFPEAWNFLDAIGTKQVEVGVLDLGFATHEDVDLDILAKCGSTIDHHGTGVAGIIGARFRDGLGIDGAAAGLARVTACAPDSSPAGSGAAECDRKVTFDAFLCGLGHLFCVKDLRVINASIGYSWAGLGIDASHAMKGKNARSVVEAQGAIVRRLLAAHSEVVMVVSAGNDCLDARDCSRHTVWNSPFTWAALAPETNASPVASNVIVVDAITTAGAPHPKSNGGGTLSAIGQDIPATVRTRDGKKYGFMSGTSAATPLVTSAVVLMLARNDRLTMARIKSNLTGAGGKLDAFDAVSRSSLTPELDLADLNRDRVVDDVDFGVFRTAYQQVRDRAFTDDLNGDGVIDKHPNEGRFCRVDLDGDGDVDRDDFEVMLGAWTAPNVDKQRLRAELEK